MKLSLLTLVALAAGASASPIRLITITPGGSIQPVEHLQASDDIATTPTTSTAAHNRPCHKSRPSTYLPGPLGALLKHLGVTRNEDSRGHANMIGGWKYHLEEMEHKGVPLMEGGIVRILPFAPMENHRETEDERRMRWKALEGKEGVRKHHHHSEGMHGHKHWHHKAHSFGGRLHRALYNLTPTESISLAFVLGAGIGSILHFIFMICLLSLRFFRSGSCAERRTARRERRRLRKEAKRAQREGDVVLAGAEGGGDGDVLPSYEEDQTPSYEERETQRLVHEVTEKA
ncbi:hypothetical protein BCR39DRAFT_540931 [Naematelia encephala]|uniref:Copper transporter n=1 Tax=Naematelia encephala TaxID=71784 RepID=A0A1Y2AW80_9TREE|nr:hypothetical protein BCR39DRAFT_540931 [Naematelia encephala]